MFDAYMELNTEHKIDLTAEDRLAEKAHEGLRQVALGEDQTIAGWLLYGEALNEGRRLFAGDREFGKWIVQSQLAKAVLPDDQAAAIWGAEYPEDLEATRKAFPRVRTLRGLHAKFKAPKAQKRKLEEPTPDELRVVRKLKAVIAHPSTPEGQREAAQRKLDNYTERFGKIEPEKAAPAPAKSASWGEKQTSYDWRMESFLIDRIASTLVRKAHDDPKNGGNAAFKELKKALRKACGGDATKIDRLLQKSEGL